jgi:hypothetical protein
MEKYIIKVKKEYWIDAQLKDQRYSAFLAQLKAYWLPFTLIWIVIAFIDIFNNQGHLVYQHLIAILLLFLGASIFGYLIWRRRVKASAIDYSFKAVLTEEGVITHPQEIFRTWDSYISIKDCGSYYMIKGSDGLSVLPNDIEVKEIIDVSLNKIPNK